MPLQLLVLAIRLARSGHSMTIMLLRYRCYFLGKESGILASRDFQTESDTEALATARTLAAEHKAHSFELWEAARYLHGEVC